MTSSKAFEALRRLKTSDLLYFEEQFMYGHREILLNYCLNKNQSLNNGSILRGSVNHGFAYQENIWKLRQRNLKPAKRYVWNFRQKLAYGENPNVIATGAPWLYLLGDLGLNPTNIETLLKKKPQKVVVFPSHNVETYWKYDIDKTIQNFTDRIPPGSEVTVCLFWLDFCDPNTRRAFANLGWEVVSMGYVPRLPKPDLTLGGRQNFLLELFNLFADTSLVVTDNASTGLFYALSLGVQVSYAHSDQLAKVEKTYNQNIGLGMNRPVGFFNSEKLWVEAFFPQLLETKFNPKKFLKYAWEELGYDRFIENKDGGKFEWIDSKADTNSIDLYKDRFKSIKKIVV